MYSIFHNTFTFFLSKSTDNHWFCSTQSSVACQLEPGVAFYSLLTQALILIFPIPAAGFLALLTAPPDLRSCLSARCFCTCCLNFCPSSRCCCLSCSAVGGALQKLAIPVWTRPTNPEGLLGARSHHDRQKIINIYLNPICSNPHPLKKLFILGGWVGRNPQKQCFES